MIRQCCVCKRIYEDGQMIKDFVYVEDVAEAFVLAMGCPVSGTFNIGSGIPRTMVEAANLIKHTAKSDSEVLVTGQYRVGDARHGVADTDKAERYLDFRARTLFTEGLEKLYEWARKQVVQEVLEDNKLVERGLSRDSINHPDA